MVDQTFRWAKIGEGFWVLGFATAVLIKTIFGNGDPESSQSGSGVPEGTARASVMDRDLSFLNEIFPASGYWAKMPQNVG